MTDLVAGVDTVPAAATYALRQRILRPHQRPEELGLPGDEDASTVHLAIRDRDGAVVACLRLAPVACPWRADVPSWQLRAMAVDDAVRGRGHGARLVDAAVWRVRAAGGGVLWCNARVTAQEFYARAGFVAVSEVWDEPDIGPHVGMVREVHA